jgi:carbon-monoxide dehydrogenase medium subunit
MATVGGNICNASPSADSVPPLLALGAEIVLANAQGERTVPLNEFFLGPGETVMQPGELLKEIAIPKPPKGSGSYYLRHTPRAWMDIATVGVAAYISLDKTGKIIKSRIALGAVAPTPIRAEKAESILHGQLPVEGSLEEAGMAASQETSPISDVRASADYRKHLVSVLTQRALRGAVEKAEGNR